MASSGARALAALLEMGFPRSRAEAALRRCSNRLSEATELLLGEPEPAPEPAESDRAQLLADMFPAFDIDMIRDVLSQTSSIEHAMEYFAECAEQMTRYEAREQQRAAEERDRQLEQRFAELWDSPHTKDRLMFLHGRFPMASPLLLADVYDHDNIQRTYERLLSVYPGDESSMAQTVSLFQNSTEYIDRVGNMTLRELHQHMERERPHHMAIDVALRCILDKADQLGLSPDYTIRRVTILLRVTNLAEPARSGVHYIWALMQCSDIERLPLVPAAIEREVNRRLDREENNLIDYITSLASQQQSPPPPPPPPPPLAPSAVVAVPATTAAASVDEPFSFSISAAEYSTAISTRLPSAAVARPSPPTAPKPVRAQPTVTTTASMATGTASRATPASSPTPTTTSTTTRPTPPTTPKPIRTSTTSSTGSAATAPTAAAAPSSLPATSSTQVRPEPPSAPKPVRAPQAQRTPEPVLVLTTTQIRPAPASAPRRTAAPAVVPVAAPAAAPVCVPEVVAAVPAVAVAAAPVYVPELVAVAPTVMAVAAPTRAPEPQVEVSEQETIDEQPQALPAVSAEELRGMNSASALQHLTRMRPQLATRRRPTRGPRGARDEPAAAAAGSSMSAEPTVEQVVIVAPEPASVSEPQAQTEVPPARRFRPMVPGAGPGIQFDAGAALARLRSRSDAQN